MPKTTNQAEPESGQLWTHNEKPLSATVKFITPLRTFVILESTLGFEQAPGMVPMVEFLREWRKAGPLVKAVVQGQG